jgi:hypothetical protein
VAAALVVDLLFAAGSGDDSMRRHDVAHQELAPEPRASSCPHVDRGKGEECAADAVIAAERAGLKLGDSIHLVDVRPHKDLADAWRGGWRWGWL